MHIDSAVDVKAGAPRSYQWYSTVDNKGLRPGLT